MYVYIYIYIYIYIYVASFRQEITEMQGGKSGTVDKENPQRYARP